MIDFTNITGIAKQNVSGLCNDIQINICNKANASILYPLYFGVVLWFIKLLTYWKLDFEKHPNAFRRIETATDVGILFCIVISIVWFKFSKGG